MRPFLVPLVVWMLMPAAWAAPLGVLSDAGTSGDAGGSPGTAMSLAYGSYEGNLTPGDADWFAFPAPSAPMCLSARVFSAHAMRVAVGAGASAGLVGGMEDGFFATTLAVEPVATRVGALPDAAPWDAVSVGPYAFDVAAALAPVAGDSREDDATSVPALADPVPGPCFSAYFDDDEEDGRDVDVWSFDAVASERATVSLAVGAGMAGALRVVDASGAVVAGPIASGELAEFVIPADGSFWLVAQSLTSREGAYTVALVMGPDPTGCRPYCVL